MQSEIFLKEFIQDCEKCLILSCPKCNCPLVDFESVVPQSNKSISIALRFKTYCEHKYFVVIFQPADIGMTIYSGIKKERIDYREYIESDLWKQKSLEAKERAGWRCQVCNKSRDEITLDAHHRTYERLGNELPEDITVLCRDCHELYESNRKSKSSVKHG